MSTTDYTLGDVNILSRSDYETSSKDLDELWFVEDTDSYVSKVSGTLASDSSSIPLGITLASVNQILYVNLDMAIALPSSYTLSSDGTTLNFTGSTLVSGTQWTVVYTTSAADVTPPVTYINTVNGTTSAETTDLPLGTTLSSSSQILSVNVGNTIILPTLYTLSNDGTKVVLSNSIDSGELWSVQYISIASLSAFPVATNSALGLAKTDNVGVSSNNGTISLKDDYVSGLGMPSDAYDSLTLGASGSAYTAPGNGYYVIRKTLTTSFEYIEFVNETTGIVQTFTNSDGAANFGCIFPCKQGDSVKIAYNGSGETGMFRFYYTEGETTE